MTREEALSKAIMTLIYFQAHFCKSKEAVDNTQAIIDTLEEIEQEPRWIPVSEKLPEENGRYIVCINTKTFPIKIISFAKNLGEISRDFNFKNEKAGWYDYDSEYGYFEWTEIAAWMPLPKTYEPQESEDKE